MNPENPETKKPTPTTTGDMPDPPAASADADRLRPADDGVSFLFPGVERDSEKKAGQNHPPKNETRAGLFDAHTHTPFCKHARGEIEQYATIALERGLAGLTVTCHNPMPDGFSPEMRMDLSQLDEYVMYVERARHIFEGRLEIRLGIEADF
ncbi:MAG: PHP domain-containing protein, partial [Planctomycetota bacterium]